VLAALFSWSLPIRLFCVYANARLDFTLACSRRIKRAGATKSFQNPQSAERFLSASVCQREREFLNSCLRDDAAVKFNWFQRARWKSSRGVRDARVLLQLFKDMREGAYSDRVRINILNYCVQPFEAGALQADKFYYLDSSPL